MAEKTTCMVTCPACPECPTVGIQVASDNSTSDMSDTRSSEDATTPGLNTATPDTLPNPCFQCDCEMWKRSTFCLVVVVIILIILVVVLVSLLYKQRKDGRPQKRQDPENAPCNGQDGIHYNKSNGKVSTEKFLIDSSGSTPVFCSAVSSQEQLNASYSGGPLVFTHFSVPHNEYNLAKESMAALNDCEVDVHNPPTGTGKEAGVTVATGSDVATPKKSPASEPPKSLKVNTKPLLKRDYNVSEGTPSTQPLLATSTQPGDTVASDTVTSISGHIGNNVESLQNTPPGSTSLHEAPTAPYRESPPTSPSCSAFEKSEGQCGTTSHCNEWHADFVKDNINVTNHTDFFAKLGLSKTKYEVTKYDHRHEGIQEQIRHVIINDFIGKEDNPSIYRLLSALDASGNKHVSRMFREKFNVTSSAGS
ncbi:uncharacterized protein LOC119731844 [Patiria miniata]|uniref:Uncharacterized protein n=1 Tax=Patiria miniata TaxID=46514 RepID=A0A914AB14_PATMI|nr:uncharacterized protein LOC119731844 [Patiria miniata]